MARKYAKYCFCAIFCLCGERTEGRRKERESLFVFEMRSIFTNVSPPYPSCRLLFNNWTVCMYIISYIIIKFVTIMIIVQQTIGGFHFILKKSDQKLKPHPTKREFFNRTKIKGGKNLNANIFFCHKTHLSNDVFYFLKIQKNIIDFRSFRSLYQTIFFFSFGC